MDKPTTNPEPYEIRVTHDGEPVRIANAAQGNLPFAILVAGAYKKEGFEAQVVSTKDDTVLHTA